MIIKPKNWIEFHRQKYLIEDNIDNRSSEETIRRISHITEMIDFKPEDTVLDFGCGSAYLKSVISSKYVGVDSCFENIEALKKRYDGKSFYTEIPDRTFTKIVANSVLMYLSEKEMIETIEFFYHHLIPNGLLFIGDMPIKQEHSKRKSLFRRIKMSLSPKKYLKIVNPILHYYPRDFMKLCQGFKGQYIENGCEVVYERYDYILRKI